MTEHGPPDARDREIQALREKVSQLEATQEHLRETGSLYRSVIDAIVDGVHVIDGDNRVQLFNASFARWCEKLGLPTDPIGQDLFHVFPFLPDHTREEYRQVMETGEAVTTVEHNAVENDEIVTETRKTPLVEDGKVERILTVVHNITDRERAREDLELRTRLQDLITSISTRFIALDPSQVDAEITHTLKTVGTFMDVDLCYVALYDPDSVIHDVYEWCDDGIESHLEAFRGVRADQFPWWYAKLKRGEGIRMHRVADLPPEAKAVGDAMRASGTKSTLSLPLTHGQELLGVIGFTTFRQERAWPEETVSLLRIVGDMLAHALHRKRADQALLEASDRQQRLEAVINRSPAMLFLWRVEEGWPVELASENVSHLGYSAEDFTSGRVSWPGITHPDDEARLEAEVDAYIRDGVDEFQQEYRLLTKSGEVRWVEDRNLCLRDAAGTLTHVQGIVLDITDRKRAEQELRSSEAQYRALFESTSDAVLLADGTSFIACNLAALQMFGATSQEELLVKHPGDLSPPTQPDGRDSREEVERVANQILTSGPAHFEWRHCRLDGTEFDADVLLTPIESQGRYVTQCVVRDITDRKRSEPGFPG